MVPIHPANRILPRDMLVSSICALAGAFRVVLAQAQGQFWMPPKASDYADDVDSVFGFIMAVSAFFFLLIVVLMVVFVFRYRRRQGKGPQESPSHSLALELTWSIIPFIIMCAIFYMGFRTYIGMQTPPHVPASRQIQVTAQKWAWFFTYPNGYIDKDLHVPVDEPVRLVRMTSEDVIHSLYIPAFRIKMDMVPGRYSEIWFRATEPGNYMLFCAEYCGTGHSDMSATVVVHPPGGYEKWLADAGNWLDTLPPHEAGKQIFEGKGGCVSCHRVDGTDYQGPHLNDIWGKEIALEGGSTAVVDANYVRRSILEPDADIVAGWPSVMQSYQGRLSDKEITSLVAYIQSIGDPTYDVDSATTTQPATQPAIDVTGATGDTAGTETDSTGTDTAADAGR